MAQERPAKGSAAGTRQKGPGVVTPHRAATVAASTPRQRCAKSKRGKTPQAVGAPPPKRRAGTAAGPGPSAGAPGPARSAPTGGSEADMAVQAALALHEDFLSEFVGKSKERKGPGWEGGCERAEQMASERYEEMLGAIQRLLPLIAAQEEKECRGDIAYSTLTLGGCEAGAAGGEVACCREALCAVLAAIASRREMCWLEAHGDETPVRGYFAHALTQPESCLRIAVVAASHVPRSLPASLLVTSRLPLWEALARTDNEGPLKGMPQTLLAGGTEAPGDLQLALQELDGGDDLGAHGSLPEERKLVQDLVPEPGLERLLRSAAHVLAVDAYVALAPRAVSAAHGLSEVVQAELELLLREAKAEGLAVVLQLGGCNPHRLAAKVYLRPTFTRHGLRCGYLRWRPSGKAPWAREQALANRVCLGLQLP